MAAERGYALSWGRLWGDKVAGEDQLHFGHIESAMSIRCPSDNVEWQLDTQIWSSEERSGVRHELVAWIGCHWHERWRLACISRERSLLEAEQTVARKWVPESGMGRKGVRWAMLPVFPYLGEPKCCILQTITHIFGQFTWSLWYTCWTSITRQHRLGDSKDGILLYYNYECQKSKLRVPAWFSHSKGSA